MQLLYEYKNIKACTLAESISMDTVLVTVVPRKPWLWNH
jgi:hypothetical protein